jgi:phosphoribosylamine--glycine ligase
LKPAVAELARRGIEYKGVLYAGLMITAAGPKVIEFNCRFGDPEFQVLAVRLKSDLLAALLATADGRLAATELVWHDRAALTVVLATQGYPGAYEKGSAIGNLGPASEIPDVTIFHAGTRLDGQRIVADGGRVLGVTALGDTIADARTRAYEAAAVIDWPDGFSRTDIGWRAINRG